MVIVDLESVDLLFQIHAPGHATIGGVPFCSGPAVRVIDHLHEQPAGTCSHCEPATRIRGVQLDMTNGLELSIMWGTGNYCDARFDPTTASSETAEIALFYEQRIVGDVAGWVDAAHVLALIPIIAAADPQHLVGIPQFQPRALVA